MKFIENSVWSGVYCFQCGRWEAGQQIGSQQRDKRGKFIGYERFIHCHVCNFTLNLGADALGVAGLPGETWAEKEEAYRKALEKRIQRAHREYLRNT